MHSVQWKYLALLGGMCIHECEAGTSVDFDIDWLPLVMGLLGGLALFLAGLDMLSDGLRKATGDTLKFLLNKLTTNRFMGAVTGAFVTGLVNSSSVTTVLVVSFITAKMMTLTQAVGVIMGANIGSTVTAQLLAFNVSEYGLLAVAVGFFIKFIVKAEKIKYYGMMLMGMGLIFFGMGLMSDAMRPMRHYAPFMVILEQLNNPIAGVLAGAVFTGLIQSSSATIGIAITLASDGMLALPAGIALALGANIGTCATALLASIKKPVDAVRASVVHILFNVIGVLLWVGFIPELAGLANQLTSLGNSLFHLAPKPHNVARELANANTIFNVLNTLFFIGFAPFFARIATKIVPDKRAKPIHIIPKYLDDEALSTPAVALNLVRLEIGHAGHIVQEMLDALKPAVMDGNIDALKAIAKLDDDVDILEKAIFDYLGQMRSFTLTKKESKLHCDLMAGIVNLEHLADLIETDLVKIGKEIIEHDYQPNTKTAKLMVQMYEQVSLAVALSVKSIATVDEESARVVIGMKSEINALGDLILKRESKKLSADESQFLEASLMELSFIDKLQRIYTLSRRIAKEART